MGAFEKAMSAFAGIRDEALARPWSWRGGELRVRDALYLSLAEEQDALVRARAAWEPHEAERVLSLARRAFGDLCGLLVGLPDATLDEARDGAWTLRDVLRHALGVERRYAANTLYAAHRRDDEPLGLPPGDPRLPKTEDVDVSGGVELVLERFAAARDRSDALLGSLPDAALARPAQWTKMDVDVRFRLHRFAAHLVEHTVQCEKALESSGARQGEARRIVRWIWATRGELEATGDESAIGRLDEAHTNRAGSLLVAP